MIKPEQIPDEVVEAAARAMCRADHADEAIWDCWIEPAQIAIAAALAAWPGAKEHTVQVPDEASDDIRYVLKRLGIILPLPEAPQERISTENSDE